MKKTLLWVMMLLLLVCVVSCNHSEDEVPVEEDPTDEEVQETEEETDVPAGKVFEEAAFLDNELDLFLLFDSSRLAYTKDINPYSVHFYPQETSLQPDQAGYTISAQDKTKTTPDAVWEASMPNIEASIADFEWIQEEPVDVGGYTAERYHYWGRGIRGDYIIWESQSLLYTCILTAQEADYYECLDLLLQSLESFRALSEMPYG